MSAEIKDEMKMKYGWLERANLLWKVLEQMYGSSNSKRSSSSAPENISLSSTHFDQDQEEQSSVQKEELNYASLGKPDGPVSQTGVSNFGKIVIVLDKEDDCSTSSSNIDDDDNIDGEYDEQEFLMEFKKHISKHMKLQKRHGDLLCSHKELIDSYALLESTYDVMVTKVKNTIDLSCANSCCSQAKPSCDEYVPVETCDDLIASENDELKRENEPLRMEL
ncbi:hypothetical protein, partial [Arcobacter sp.]|uniref:hypothetical protein n=1 Tax=Arcobacter sp. TaxID=1872629 RepID=UPI003D1417D2